VSAVTESTQEPGGIPALRTIAMPRDANANGDIFGGWLLSQMDLAGAVVAQERCCGRTATVAVEGMSFLAPVKVGDTVSCHAELVHTGRSSMRVRIRAYVRRLKDQSVVKVTEGLFTYVAIDDEGRSRALPDLP
jgi:acyl-CoA thioesterase YciA